MHSMTGYGRGRHEDDGCACTVEVRSVNNRFLKLVPHLPESHASLEARIEPVVRQVVRRGTVTVVVHVERSASPTHYRLRRDVIDAYLRQLAPEAPSHTLLAAALTLPGVVEELPDPCGPERDWPAIERALGLALEELGVMRVREGAAMQRELVETHEAIADILAELRLLAPEALAAQQERVGQRLEGWIAERGLTLEPADLSRELAALACRGDVNEELVRLDCHLAQLCTMVAGGAGGRKIEFLNQEMLREANTIGSKAGDARIAAHVVELKCRLEHVRELVQNVE